MEHFEQFTGFRKINTVFIPSAIVGWPGTTADYCKYVLGITDEAKCYAAVDHMMNSDVFGKRNVESEMGMYIISNEIAQYSDG